MKEAKALIGAFEALAEAVGELAGAVAGRNVNDEVNPLIQQFQPHFQHLLKTELHFVRKICEPTDEQYKAIQAAGNESLRNAVKKFAQHQLRMQRGGGDRREDQSMSDPRHTIATELANTIEETLSVEQLKRYQHELEKRSAARKRAGLLSLVAHMDKELILSADQRVKLQEVLESKWNDSWSSNLEAMMYGSQFMPVVPDDLMMPLLNEKQQEIWRQTPRHNNVIWGFAGLGFVQAVDLEAAPAADEKAPEK